VNDKRKPTLADRFLASRGKGSLTTPEVEDAVRRSLRTAKQFVLDDRAVEHIGRLMRDVPDLLIPQLRFARAPFEHTWIEFDASVLWKAHNDMEPDTDGDTAFGILIDGNAAYTVIGGTIEWGPTPPRVSPLVYHLNTPWGDAEEDDPYRQRVQMANALGDLGMSPLTLQHFYWGSMYHRAAAQGVKLYEHSLQVLPLRDKRMLPFLHDLWQSGLGELRNILIVLTVLNRPSLLTVVREQGRSRGFIGNRPAPYWAHSVVTINLDRKESVLRLTDSAGTTKRRHEVRGHWCHDRRCRESQCIHDWTPHPDYMDRDDPAEPDHWQCTQCQGKRWWRAEHARGDAGKGFSVRDGYHVISTQEE